ncbi:DeSI-like protein [Zea mays]|uniref:DeSI-like protein n=1 Tax=Zea mays TaxID=4577 RepID=A0A1D6P1Q2_MAIZE|nr:DeSI-like protein [Zea mays]
MEDNPNYFQAPFAIAFYQKACGLSQLKQSILETVVSQSHVVLLSVNLDGSNTTSNDNSDEDELEDKHLLPTTSVGEDTIVKEIHR